MIHLEQWLEILLGFLSSLPLKCCRPGHVYTSPAVMLSHRWGPQPTRLGSALTGPLVRSGQLFELCLCLLGLQVGNNDYTVYVWPPDLNHSKDLRERLSAPYMNMILRLLLKIKSYIHRPHSLLHNGLPCVQSLPRCLQPNKPSIYLCHVPFALWQWTIHRRGWGRETYTSLVLQPLCQEQPKQEMEQRTVCLF